MKTARSPINTRTLIPYLKTQPAYKEALELAKKLYLKDKREYTGMEYLSHPLTVGSLLIDFEVSVHAMVLSALMDVMPRGKQTEAQLIEQFGSDVVADLKILASPKASDPAGYAGFAERLKQGSAEVKTVMLAAMLDRICAVPANKLKHAASTFLQDYKLLLPVLKEGGHPEMVTRVEGALRRALA